MLLLFAISLVWIDIFCQNVGSYSTCQRYRFPMGTFGMEGLSDPFCFLFAVALFATEHSPLNTDSKLDVMEVEDFCRTHMHVCIREMAQDRIGYALATD